MLKILSKLIVKLLGWKIVGEIPPDIKKAVLIVAPHTSNYDFFIGRLAFFILGVRVKFLIKKELFKFPFGLLLRMLGSIPVDRSSSNNMVKYVANLFNRYDSLIVTITPEGTRKYNPNWKKGFYYIAQMANLPIILGFVNYKIKEGGVGPIITPSGDFKKDFEFIENFYRDKTARFPEKFNLTPGNNR